MTAFLVAVIAALIWRVGPLSRGWPFMAGAGDGPEPSRLILLEQLAPLTDAATAGLVSAKSLLGTQDATWRALEELTEDFNRMEVKMRALQDRLVQAHSDDTVVSASEEELELGQAEARETHARLLARAGEVQDLASLHMEETSALVERALAEAARAEELRGRPTRGDLSLEVVALSLNLGEEAGRVKALVEEVDAVQGVVEGALKLNEPHGAAELAAELAGAAVRAGEARGAGGGEGGEHTATFDDGDLEAWAAEAVSEWESAQPPPGEHVDKEAVVNLARERLYKLAADGTGLPDYAMGPAGGRVIPSLTSPTYSQPSGGMAKALTRLAKLRKAVGGGPTRVPGPEEAISPDSSMGHCWPFAGTRGRLTVWLRQPVDVTAVSLEHLPKEIALNGGHSAPREFRVLGYPEGWEDDGAGRGGEVILQGVAYDAVGGESIQTFQAPRSGFRSVAVTLEILSNHGERAYTCLYRLRVHGETDEGLVENYY